MSKSIPAGTMKRTIAYYYQLSYCPPTMIAEFKMSTEAHRKDLAKEAGMNQQEFFEQAVPEVCQRIVSFHEDTREPSAEFVEPLLAAALQAQASPEAEDRYRTYREVLEEHGLAFDPDLVAEGDFLAVSGSEAISLLLVIAMIGAVLLAKRRL